MEWLQTLLDSSTAPALTAFLLGLLNSKIMLYLVQILNPTLAIYPNNIANIPFRMASKEDVDKVVDENIEISKTDWDSFETSWDFKEHPLVEISEGLWDATATAAAMDYYYGHLPEVSCPLEVCYLLWQGQCKERFNQLKANEEELNRIFIDIYGLQDELTPEVEDKDVTVRKANLQRDIKSLLSYAVGCMFGRYSLDVPGLAYAGGEWDSSKYKTFIPDDDNVIPITDEDYLEDDIVSRLCAWLKVVYGEDTLEANLDYIAKALGNKGSTSREIIRNYFLNDFYADHCKIYQKRPIYWLFDSGKKNGFKCLIYLHRYQPDTIARIRTDYVHEQQARYRTAIEGLEKQVAAATSTSERVKLTKQLNKVQAQDAELHQYEEKVHALADQMIKIDLDDGVKHNYEIFKDVLAKIK